MNANKLLITLEMANNHMGSCEHGRNIIKEFSPFNDFDSRIELAFKLHIEISIPLYDRTTVDALT